MLPAETPKLAKWPFLVGDATLLGLAWLVASQSRAPLSGIALITVATCVVVGAILAVIPFLSDYARRQDEALDDRQRGLDGLARTVAATAEQISIAANGLHEIAALAQRNLKSAETLTGAIEARGAGGIAAAAPDFDRLQVAAEKASRAASELARFEVAAQKNFSAAAETLARTTAAIETLNARIAAKAVAASVSSTPFEPPQEPPRGMPPISTDPFVPPTGDSQSPSPADTASSAVASVEAETPVPAAANPDTPPATITTQAIVPDKPKRVRKPREKKPADDLVLNAEASSNGAATAVLDEPAAEGPEHGRGGAPKASEVVERVRTSDGATRLIVTAYIGIGNRLFIRGEGPGLSWDKGTPLQFISIGRWRWESADADAPVKFKLYKNDAVECTSLGEQSIDPGQQEEITALF